VLWGTDSIWYGSRRQIQAFRTSNFGCVRRTIPAIRRSHLPCAPRFSYGRNALKVYKVPSDVLKEHLPKDRFAQDRKEYRERPDPAFVTLRTNRRGASFLRCSSWSSHGRLKRRRLCRDQREVVADFLERAPRTRLARYPIGVSYPASAIRIKLSFTPKTTSDSR
jgi:hypothetical protein